MTNALYPAFKTRLISPGADLVAGLLGAGAGENPTAAPLKALLLKTGASGYTYSAAHDFLDDVSAHAIGTAIAVAGGSVAAGVFNADDIVFEAVAAGAPVGGLVLFMDTGTPATSPLVAFVDTGTDGALAIATSGGNITIKWDDGPNKVFAL